MTVNSLIEDTIKTELEKIRPPEEIRNELDITYTFDKNILEISEVRPSFINQFETLKIPIARARYYKSQEIWKIYWRRANQKWDAYAIPKVNSIHDFFKILKKDEYGCFFG